MNKSRFLVARSACGFLVSLFLSANPVQAEPFKMDTFDIPPWGFSGEDGLPSGIYYETAQAITREAGIDAEHEIGRASCRERVFVCV